MRFVSFNINGIRAHIHQIEALIEQLRPDIIGLQETKVSDEIFPVEKIQTHGYHVYYNGQKQYHGVALFLKKNPLHIIQNFKENYYLSKSRIITAQILTSIGILTVINVYCPQGENKYSNKFIYKEQFYHNLQNYIQNTYNKKSLLLIMGDMNIAPTDLDIGISEKNKKKWLKLGKCAFLPEEKKWINRLENWGLIDIYRKQYPYKNKRYSWFSYQSYGFNKNIGLRIDLILITQPLVPFHTHSNISYCIRGMPRSSDHAPIWSDLNI